MILSRRGCDKENKKTWGVLIFRIGDKYDQAIRICEQLTKEDANKIYEQCKEDYLNDKLKAIEIDSTETTYGKKRFIPKNNITLINLRSDMD